MSERSTDITHEYLDELIGEITGKEIAMVITAKQLKDLEACEDELELFMIHFGESAEVTLSNCLEAAELELNIYWLAEKILSRDALAEYKKTTEPARDEYRKTIEPARDEYRKTIKPMLDEYLKTIKLALDEYEKAAKPARAKLLKAYAAAFYNVVKRGEQW